VACVHWCSMALATQSRLEFLHATQNSDGGWGFFPRKQSWLEPTAYALLALHGEPAAKPVAERGWKLIRSWQLPDGSWQACAAVRESHWTTALAVTLHAVHEAYDDAFQRGAAWLLQTKGFESSLTFRIAHMLRPNVVELDPGLKAWPWRPGTSSWIEPTAHSLVALKKAFGKVTAKDLGERVSLGERMILERRCTDGGWNYGNRKVLGTELPSYPETTGIALLGLAGNHSLDLGTQLALARRMMGETKSPLARAWLRLALRSHSIPLAETPPDPAAEGDTLVAALEVMATTGVLA
ncbi:MAG: prenyltransferase/squalene oxidase repeat-containing protein, partial [Bryobacteraceae bacterium]